MSGGGVRADTTLREAEDVIVRVQRKYENDCADNALRPKYHRGDVDGWLAGVSYAEWFALVDRIRELEDEAVSFQKGTE